jgi:hypothetical protein
MVLNRVCCLLFAASLAGLSGNALAADMPMPAKAPVVAPALETWSFAFTPYAWLTALNGSSTVRGRTTNLDASFADILNNTQFPKVLFQLAAFGEARYGRWAVLLDAAYMKMALGRSLMASRTVDDVNAGVGAGLGLTMEMVIVEAALAYEVARWNGLTAPGSTTALDLYAGARTWWQRGKLDLALSGSVNTADLTLTAERNLSAEANVSWVDPVVGARIRHQFAPRWDLVVSGDIGGFGAGSKFSWQAIGALAYEVSRSKSVSWSGMLGYKALSVDYSKGSGLSHYEFDMVIHGPILGLVDRF